MIKVLLIDADGVSIKPHKNFSEIYAAQNNVSLDLITPFFKEQFPACQKGAADLKTEIAPYLPTWNWQGSVDEFLDLWFKTETIIDDAVLAVVAKLRGKGVKCYLATDQEKYRAEYLQNVLRFDERFDGAYYSCFVGHKKSEPEFFAHILKDLQVAAADVGYVDDDKKNVAVAGALGIEAWFYESLGDLEKYLSYV